MKHLVASGCSFTSLLKPNIDITPEYDLEKKEKSLWTWVDWIQYYNKDNYQIHNYGCPTNDNDTIVESALYGINKLLKSGTSTNDIELIIQWSAASRNSFFIPKGMFDNSKLNITTHTNDFISEKRYKYDKGFKYLTGGYNKTNNLDELNDISFNYLALEYSNEERIISWLKNIILISNFCKNLGIKYKFFQMSNNISSNMLSKFEDINVKSKRNTEPSMPIRPDLIETKLIGNTWNADMFLETPYITYLKELVDFQNDFWFYEIENYHKFGGAIEWSVGEWDDTIKDDENIGLKEIIYFEMEGLSDKEKADYFNHRSYGHPSALMWRKFYFDVLKPNFL
jgi:hypothetical protein